MVEEQENLSLVFCRAGSDMLFSYGGRSQLICHVTCSNLHKQLLHYSIGSRILSLSYHIVIIS